MTQPRSLGRKSIRASLKPADLMADETLAHAWRAEVITLLPEAWPGVLGASLTGRALSDGKWQLRTHDLREHGEGRHRNVDDTPAGGGAGMVLRADILGRAIETAADPRHPLPMLLLSPRGQRFDQAFAARLAAGPGAIFVCGRFEGVDERAIEHYGLIEVSLGDFVLTGGDLAAQAMIDAALRLRPGILGNAASAEEESFSAGLLEHPQYTKPAEWQDRPIPEVLLSGHHGRIAEWRQKQAEAVTRARRPDLWAAYARAKGLPEE
ncbi:tRNA (guanosine(37)-N1)-methyltransferase TrmD [Pseudoroseicyclus tamaricis]|uniref:tRNA (guanine-N(1)-)-methyltransferase n=1 Tax=Pseudoroseicyclus tamaricis TaxID=2705421 RepID=A0A6B2JUB5_9RHOB|nr:tRNA (guanosine(37)-N1)-methyltransferase TrmD [Pseudoroseicyclus tamaricis]NDV02127.1 tRNA (guanosine(37)-N1)-methyltransferase TrmD [Pseudoroseicyclus tamaricis]